MRVLILLPLLLGILGAQNTPPTSTPDSTEGRKLGRVEGVVMNAVTNAPLARATVMLRSMGRTGGAAGTPMVMAEGFNQMVPQDAPVSGATGADGKFVIENVPEGKYSAMAARATFLVGYYGGDGPGSRSLITVAAGGSVKDITIKLSPQAILTGRVTDADGEPMQGVMVQAARWNYFTGQKSLVPMGSAQTNDLGEYRIANLTPGKYFLIANQVSRMMGSAPSGQREAVPQTYYPNSLDSTGASQVTVEAGAEMRGLDFRLRKLPAVMISGSVVGAPQGGMVMLNIVPVDESAGMIARMTPRFVQVQNGKFGAGGLLPGTYEIRVDYRPGKNADQQFGRLRIDVGKEDLKDLEIVLAPGAQVSGSLRVEGGELPGGATGGGAANASSFGALPSASGLRVGLRSQEGMMQQSAVPEKDLTFQVQGIAPGKYSPFLMVPPGFFIKSVKIDDREGGDQYFDVLPQAQIKLEILLARGGAEVTGTAEGLDGKPCVTCGISLHSVEPSVRADREKFVTTDAKGGFRIPNIPPGSYRVFAWDGTGNQEWRAAAFRKEFEGNSATVKLTETAKETVTLKANPLPK